METFDYLGPQGDKDPFGLHRADFERRKLQWLIERAQAPEKGGATSPEAAADIAARVAMLRRMIEQHDQEWGPVRARALATPPVATGHRCPDCDKAFKPGARFCVGCGCALTATPE